MQAKTFTRAALAGAAALLAQACAHAATFTTVHQFNGTDGTGPNELIEKGGVYYGTTGAGGAHFSNGEVFKMTKSGTVTVLYSFDGTTGSRPHGALVDGNDGYLYGVTYAAGTYNGGTAFKVSVSTGALTFIHQFGAAGEGQGATSLTYGNDGNFYGTTLWGGTSNAGTIFKMTKAGVVTTLHSFTGTDGSTPEDHLVSTGNGTYYGIAGGGASSCGVFFKITNAGAYTLLYTFPKAAPAGCQPMGRLEWANNLMYGTTQMGGAYNQGTVFSFTLDGTPTWLYSFTGGADGANPIGGVTQANNFLLYGTTHGGGTYKTGTTFKISASGALTTLHQFNPALLAETTGPNTPLLYDSSLNMIGSTPGYSSSTNGGSTFRQTP